MENELYLYERRNHDLTKHGLTRLADRVLGRETADRVWEVGIHMDDAVFPGWVTGYVVESGGDFYVSTAPNMRGENLESQDFDEAFNRVAEDLAGFRYEWFDETIGLDLDPENFEIGYGEYRELNPV
ncbi:MAG: hypothetical protein ABEK10_01420 [Candidatus Nanosalina sp.]